MPSLYGQSQIPSSMQAVNQPCQQIPNQMYQQQQSQVPGGHNMYNQQQVQQAQVQTGHMYPQQQPVQQMHVQQQPVQPQQQMQYQQHQQPIQQHQTQPQQPQQVPQTPIQPTSPYLCQTSVSALPGIKSLKAKANVPLGMVFSPMLIDVPNVSVDKIVRCMKCRSYINCYAKFINGGSKYVCNLCEHENDVPNDYFCDLDHMGNRLDLAQRPELINGTVEYAATPEYMNRAPMKPSFCFLIDVSRQALASGLTRCITYCLQDLIAKDVIPCDERTQVSIITFDTSVHYYRITNDIVSISVVGGQSRHIFAPEPEMMLNLKEYKLQIIKLLSQLESYWSHNLEASKLGAGAETVNFASALTAAKQTLGSNGGRILCSFASVPTAPELGLNPSSRRNGEELKSSTNYFSSTATTLAHSHIGVDLVVGCEEATDLATVSQLATGSGGNVYHFPAFNGTRDFYALYEQLCVGFQSICGWESVMRIRPSTGWKIMSYTGSYCFRHSDLMMLPSFTRSQTVGITLDAPENVLTSPFCYLQCAVLFTNNSGERRIRVVNICLPTTNQLDQMMSGINIDVCSYLIASRALGDVSTITPAGGAAPGPINYHGPAKMKLKDARAHITASYTAIMQALAHVFPGSPTPHDISIPINFNDPQLCAAYAFASLIKCDAFTDQALPDDRVRCLLKIKTCPLSVLRLILYPKLFEVTSMTGHAGLTDNSGNLILPYQYRLTTRTLNPRGVYLVGNSLKLVLLLGNECRADWIEEVFGSTSPEHINTTVLESSIRQPQTDSVRRLANLIAWLRRESGSRVSITICRMGDSTEHAFNSLMVEDKKAMIGAGFTEFYDKYKSKRQY